MSAKINLLVTENHNLKEGQLQQIAAAEHSKPIPTLFFKTADDAKSNDSKETQIKMLPAMIDLSGENSTDALRAYQIETMRLKDELMQIRVDNFDANQKLVKLQQEAHEAITKAAEILHENNLLKRDKESLETRNDTLQMDIVE